MDGGATKMRDGPDVQQLPHRCPVADVCTFYKKFADRNTVETAKQAEGPFLAIRLNRSDVFIYP